MSYFRRGFQRHFRKPLALVSRAAIASSAAATCLFYIATEEQTHFFGEKEDISNSGAQQVWNLVPTMTAVTTTQCLGLGNFTGFFKKSQNCDDRPHLLFLGTGSSTGCPKPLCAMKFSGDVTKSTFKKFEKPDPTSCKISHLALAGGDPKSNRNYRNNPCLLIHHYDEQSQSYKNVVIDAGKTFRETALRWFPIHNVESLDAIILTHHHMDAAAGLDDVRGFQVSKKVDGKYVRKGTPLYLSDFCHLNLQSQFPWLLPKASGESIMPQQDKNRPKVTRNVASFDVTIFQDYKEEVINGFKFTPLPVWHGDDLISHGFSFTVQPGPESSSKPLNVVYLSDISRMVPETLEFIQKKLPPTDILILDSLLWDKSHAVHFSMKEAIELSQVILPTMQTYLIGMSCDNFLPHDEMNEYLREKYGACKVDKNSGAIAFAHDGLVVELPKQ